MTEVSQLINDYNDIRHRLRYPPNAVLDRGIDLKRTRIPKTDDSVPIRKVLNASEPQPVCRVTVTEVDSDQGFVTKPIKVATIVEAVCRILNIRATELKSIRRGQRVVYPRHICWYLAVKHTSLSMPQIGRLFGGKDHTTILHANNKIKRLIQDDPRTARLIDHLETVLFGDPHAKADKPGSAMATESELNLAEKQTISLPRLEICGLD